MPETAVAEYKLVRVSHIRCGETDAYTYVVAPVDWKASRIHDAVYAAEKKYLAAVEIAKEGTEAPNDYRWGPPPYEKYPDKTVAEIKAEWEAKKVVYEAWQKEQNKTKHSFAAYLLEQGFRELWDVGIAHDVDLDWGHRHGTKIDYTETRLDTMPTPAKFVGVDEDDDDEW